MSDPFLPGGLPVLIGSLPVSDHAEANRLVMTHTPEIPLWVQLPVHKQEGMIVQFMPGLPGLTREGDRQFLDTAADDFSDHLVAFYEDYMAAAEDPTGPSASRFALSPDVAEGFFAFSAALDRPGASPQALKGQVTGPLTFATAVKDREGRAIYYDDQVRDAAVKLLALKARWQIRRLTAHDRPVIIFLDEPALAGFGSSEFISISRQSVVACLNEVIEGIHAEGGLAGIHVCANTEWDMIMETDVDIVNFDAYGYFDRFILYPEAVKALLDRGGIIAWGIVPTGDPEAIAAETPEKLAEKWESQMTAVSRLGYSRQMILSRTMISPSCGTGSLSVADATRVLELTRDTSRLIRSAS